MGDVSRETAPSDAATLFPGDRLALAERYADLLATDGVLRGLIGPREGARLWSRHLLHCAALGRLLPTGATVCDIGSGAGLPGIVLAVARPDLTVTLVEPLLRRCVFLGEAVASLGLARVEVVRARAEELHGARTFDAVTSRAVAPLPRLLDWSMPLVGAGGSLVAMKGSSAATEVAAAQDTLRAWGCSPPEVLTVGEDVSGATTTVVRVVWADGPRGKLAAGSPAGASPRRRRSPNTRRKQAP
jgi:16S rRNA (guanine527-N7)-methyltransferase